jgi:flagellar basal body rod protein FlgG
VNRFLKMFLYGGFVFGLGTLAARTVLVNTQPVATDVRANAAMIVPFATEPQSPMRSEPVSAEHDALPHEDLSDAIARFQLVSSSRDIAGTGQNDFDDGPSPAGPEATTAAIIHRFPDLPPKVLAGWVDAYQDMPVAELERLLDHKRLLPDMMPASSFFSEQTESTVPDIGSVDNRNAIDCAIRHLQHNLRHATTPGFRRTVVSTTTPAVSAGSGANAVHLRTDFDLTPGPLQKSGSPLHLAIVDQPQLWFRLQPDHLLTRCGQFVRLDDGRLGISDEKTLFPLYGDVKIPSVYRELSVNSDGAVTYLNEQGEQKSAGRLQLAEITDPTSLTSANGVYFARKANGLPLVMTGNIIVQAGMLESANVVPNDEHNLLRHFEELRSFEESP